MEPLKPTKGHSSWTELDRMWESALLWAVNSKYRELLKHGIRIGRRVNHICQCAVIHVSKLAQAIHPAGQTCTYSILVHHASLPISLYYSSTLTSQDVWAQHFILVSISCLFGLSFPFLVYLTQQGCHLLLSSPTHTFSIVYSNTLLKLLINYLPTWGFPPSLDQAFIYVNHVCMYY